MNSNYLESFILVTCLVLQCTAIRVYWNTNTGPIVPPTPRTTVPPRPPFREPAPVWEDQSDDIPNPNPYIYVLPPPSRPRPTTNNYLTSDRRPFTPNNYYFYNNNNNNNNYNYGNLIPPNSVAQQDAYKQVNGNNVAGLSPQYVPNVGFRYFAIIPKNNGNTNVKRTPMQPFSPSDELSVGYNFIARNTANISGNNNSNNNNISNVKKAQKKYNAKTKKYKFTNYEKVNYKPQQQSQQSQQLQQPSHNSNNQQLNYLPQYQVTEFDLPEEKAFHLMFDNRQLVSTAQQLPEFTVSHSFNEAIGSQFTEKTIHQQQQQQQPMPSENQQAQQQQQLHDQLEQQQQREQQKTLEKRQNEVMHEQRKQQQFFKSLEQLERLEQLQRLASILEQQLPDQRPEQWSNDFQSSAIKQQQTLSSTKEAKLLHVKDFIENPSKIVAAAKPEKPNNFL